MHALEVEMRIAEGEPARQARLTFVREQAGPLEAHDAEKGIFKRRLPMGLAAMKWSCAQRGTGDVGPAIMRADGVGRPRERTRRGRDAFARFGTFAVARTGYRTPEEPGICPLDAQVNLPERCDSYCLPEWMTLCAVEHPVQASTGLLAPLCDRDRAESVRMAVAQEAPADDEGFYAPRPVLQEDTEGALLVGSLDGTGVPMSTAEAVTRHATWGTGEKRQQQQAALVGVCSTVAAKPRAPEARAALLVEPETARARRQQEAGGDDAPRAQQVRRLARLVRTQQAVMAGLKADAERRDPPHRQPWVVLLDGALGRWNRAPTLFREWRRVTCVLDSMHVVGDRWSAANAWCGDGAKAGKRWGQQQLTAILRGRVGYVIGGWRQILTKRQRRRSVRETRATVITCFHNHRRWMPYDVSVAAGWPVATGVVESACGSVVKHRMAGEGKRWSLKGAEAILALRSLKKSHDHDLRDYWRFRAHHVRARRYGRQLK